MNAREMFRVGDRVRLTEKGRQWRRRGPDRRGTVVGYGRGAGLVRVLWDRFKSPATYHCQFIELDDPDFDPLYLGM